MNSDFIIITFDDEDEALKVLEAMESMRKEPLLNLEQAIIVTRDRAGKVRLHQRQDLTANTDTAHREMLTLLAGLIFGNPLGVVWGIDIGDVTDQLTQRGFDNKFIQVVDRSVSNNTSAILFLTHRDSRSDPDEILNILGLFKGKIHHTTVSPNARDYLAQILAEQKSSS